MCCSKNHRVIKDLLEPPDPLRSPLGTPAAEPALGVSVNANLSNEESFLPWIH